MAQVIILNTNQIRVLRDLGKGYGQGLSFSNVHVSSVAGAQCDWHYDNSAWQRLNDAVNIGCIDIEVSREELVTYLDWYSKRERDHEELRQTFGTYKALSQPEKDLLTYLRLVQAFNYPEDIKKD